MQPHGPTPTRWERVQPHGPIQLHLEPFELHRLSPTHKGAVQRHGPHQTHFGPHAAARGKSKAMEPCTTAQAHWDPCNCMGPVKSIEARCHCTRTGLGSWSPRGANSPFGPHATAWAQSTLVGRCGCTGPAALYLTLPVWLHRALVDLPLCMCFYEAALKWTWTLRLQIWPQRA